jgi:hypothetical protein
VIAVIAKSPVMLYKYSLVSTAPFCYCYRSPYVHKLYPMGTPPGACPLPTETFYELLQKAEISPLDQHFVKSLGRNNLDLLRDKTFLCFDQNGLLIGYYDCRGHFHGTSIFLVYFYDTPCEQALTKLVELVTKILGRV